MWDVMDHGDAASHRFIADELREHRPDDAVLDEEGAEDPPVRGRPCGSSIRWTAREYGEGRHDWAVHVALWDRDHLWPGQALPALDRVVATDLRRWCQVDRGAAARQCRARGRRMRRSSSPTRSAPSRFVSVRRRQGDGGRARRGRHLPARRRHVPVGLGAPAAVATPPTARESRRRLAARLQRAQRVALDFLVAAGAAPALLDAPWR